MAAPRARRVWLAVHRWLGLGVGSVLVLLGLTGSVIVFDHALDDRLNPVLFTPRANGPPRPVDDVVAAARTAVHGRLSSVTWPGVDHDVFRVHVIEPARPAERARRVEVTVDPASAAVLGRRESGTHLVAVVYRLHRTLLLRDLWGIREAGEYIVGAAGVVLLLSTATGLYLWWPRWRQIRLAVGVKLRGTHKRLNFDLHRAGGFWSAAVLLALAMSGLYLSLPAVVRAVVGAIAPMRPRPVGLASTPIPGAAPLSPGHAAAIASAAVSGGTPTFVSLPADPRGTTSVWLRRPGDVRSVYGDVIVWLDQWDGRVLHVRDGRTLPGGEAFIHWMFPLHSGEVFGLPGRLIVCAAGLSPLLLSVTGMLIWWRKRRVRRRARTRVDPLGEGDRNLPALSRG